MAETKALAFVNRVLKTNYTNLHTDLKTGVALCELMNEVCLRIVIKLILGNLEPPR